MALFRFGQSQRSQPALPEKAAAAPARPLAPPSTGERLAEQLRAIAGGPVPEDALEPALQTILESVHVSAGAICLYDPRRELLRLAVEIGLSDDGCQALRSVRRGVGTNWDIPLSSLLNRRAYLIESAAKNRYVPALVDEGTPLRTVACLPLFAGGNALGSLILIARGQETLIERDIRSVEQGARELGRIIEAIRRRATSAEPAPPSTVPPPAAPKPVAVVATRAPVVPDAASEQSAPTSAHSPTPTPPPDDAALEVLRTRIGDLEAAAERAAAADRAQRTTLEQRLMEMQSARDRLAAELEAARAQVASTDAAATTASAHERTLTELRDERDQLGRDLEVLRARLTDVEAAALRDEAARHAHAAELAGRAESSQAELHHAHQVAQARVQELEQRAGDLEAERDRSERATAEAETARAAAADDAAGARAERDRLALEVETLRADLAALQPRTAEMEAALATAVAAREAAEQRLGDAEAERRRGHDAIQAAEDARAAAAADAEATAVEKQLLETELEKLRTRIADLEREASAPRPEPARGAAKKPAVVVPLKPETAAADPPAESAPPDKLIVVLDTDWSWESSSVADHRITVVAPNGDAVERLATMAPARILANLAAPGVLDALVALRGAGRTTRVWGCLATPESGRALALGMVEAVPRPLDTDGVLAMLGGYVGRGARIFTAGTDADALISLRQALARQGMSVSIAWDGKQAGDLLDMIRPDLAVIDLALPPRNGYGIVARLSGAGQLPALALVFGSEDSATGFSAALAEKAVGERIVTRAQLLMDVLERSETASAERR